MRTLCVLLCILFTGIFIVNCGSKGKEEIKTDVKLGERTKTEVKVEEEGKIKRKWDKFYLTMSEKEFLEVLGDSVYENKVLHKPGSPLKTYCTSSYAYSTKTRLTKQWHFFEEKLYGYDDRYTFRFYESEIENYNDAEGEWRVFCGKAAKTYGEPLVEGLSSYGWTDRETILIIRHDDNAVTVGYCDIELQVKLEQVEEEAAPEF